MSERNGLSIRRVTEVAGLRIALGAVAVAQFGDLDAQGYTKLDVLYHGVAARLKKAEGNDADAAYHLRRQADIKTQIKGGQS